MKQTILTFITAIEPAKSKELTALLAKIQVDLYGNDYIPFASIGLLHFASFVIVDNANQAPLLIFENNFDDDLAAYLDELLSVAGKGLHQVYQSCKGYTSAAYEPQNLKDYLTVHIVRPNAFHIGNVGRKSKDIHHNRQLRLSTESFLDKLMTIQKPSGLKPVDLRKKIQNFDQTLNNNLFSALPAHQTFWQKFIPWVNLVLAAIFAAVLIIGLFPVFIIAIWYLSYKENRDKSVTAPAPLGHVNVLMDSENKIAQNHLASITMIKPGWFRLNLLKVVLFAANLLARTSNKGTLSGIPSIHFAHWSIIGNNQLLFLSNFDGSWSSYLDDFIDKAHTGLTGIWSNTVGFPKTRFLVFEGATDELRFKAFARNMQVPSQVWYSAYPDLTVQNIDSDSAIRENVLPELSEAETKNWLKLF